MECANGNSIGQWHVTLHIKKDDKKRLFLLHIEVDSRIPADNAVTYMISVQWFVLFFPQSLEKKIGPTENMILLPCIFDKALLWSHFK